jgi:crotonobetainyl-CoA:carnitine CoA-transferase CaiB-like acyl-CoA transferase
MTEVLCGVRMVSLATNLPGPLAAARCAALGADVVKVEPPSGDALAAVAPGWYQVLTAGQEVRVLDLKSEAGRGDLLEVLTDADVLLTATRPSALARLGLSWDELSAKFPRLCQVAIVGHAGGHAELPGHDLTYQAEVGLIEAAMPRSPFADFAGAERAATEICAGLLGRELHGHSSYREVSLAAAAFELAEPLRRGLTAPGGVLGGSTPGYGIYATRRGHVAVACLEPHFLRRLVDELGADGDRDSLQAAFCTRTAAEWEQWALARDIPLVRIVTDETKEI